MEATKTDLRLLLECLKYQMKWPGSQKQALLTIISICKQSGQYVEFFREIGGISFIYNLSKSSTFSQVKETALFTLASLAELHESCKQTLCKEETFRDLAQHLEEKMPLTEKRVAVYMLSVLVANNRCGQTLAKTSRCIETLLNLFRQSFPDSNDSYEQLQLWATVSSALCGSVNNPQNEQLVSSLSELRVIPGLLCLLSSPNLDQQDKLAVVLTIGHLTDACVEHQSQLLSAGGLPVMISLLTEASDEEIRKAAVFVLHTCKRITESLGAGMSSMDIQDCDLERHRQSAGEILQRIQHLEKKMGVKLWERDIESQQRNMQRSASSVECNEAMWECSVMRKVKGHHRVCEELHTTPTGTLEHPITNEIPYDQESLQCVSSDECLSPAQVTHFKRSSWEKGKEREHEQMRENERNNERSDNQERRRERDIKKRDMEIKSERVAKRLKMMNLDSDINGNKHLQHCSTPARGSRDTQRPDIFRHPDPMKRNQCTRTLSDDEMSLCSELLDREINRFLKPPSPNKPSNLRCAGFRLTPLRRPCETYGFRLTPLRRPCETYGPDMEENVDHRHLKRTSECWHPKNTSCSHRERRNWSADELCYLKMGMKRFGRAWNSILWTYPFQPGRTNVDLAKKYRHMQKTKAQGVDLSHARDV